MAPDLAIAEAATMARPQLLRACDLLHSIAGLQHLPLFGSTHKLNKPHTSTFYS